MTEINTGSAANTPQTTDNVVLLPTHTQSEPQDTFSAFVRDHPVMAIAGGVALGILASALLPRRPVRKLAARAGGLAEVASAASLMLGRHMVEAAEHTGAEIGKQVHVVADRVGRFGEAAAEQTERAAGRAERIGHAAFGRLERLGTAAVGTPGELMARVRPAPPTLSARMAAKAGKLAGMAEGWILRVRPAPRTFTEKVTVKASELKGRVHR